MSMFEQVSRMNESFGNQKGNPLKINGNKLVAQCKNIASEFQELMKPLGFDVAFQFTPREDPNKPSIDDIRDALCDIMVFALGAHHIMGYDANRDMTSVIDGVMTRFCKDNDEECATIEKYDELGISLYAEGEYPTRCLKSTHDQLGKDGDTYPKGKFVKSVGYHKPAFYQVLNEQAPAMAGKVVDEMQLEREELHRRWSEKKRLIDAQVLAYRGKLESEANNLPPYDPIRGI
jgi:hypothetical protein